jgi:hypothetical protein
VAPTLSTRSRLRHHLSALGYRRDCHRFSHSGWTIMPSGPSLCSYKRACKDDLGSPLQSDGRTFWRGENCGRSSETFLLAKTSTGRQQVYQILHLPVPLPSQPSRSKAYTPLFLLPRSLGNPSQWITCLAFHPPSKAMTVYLWSLIGFRRWPSSQPARRISQ